MAKHCPVCNSTKVTKSGYGIACKKCGYCNRKEMKALKPIHDFVDSVLKESKNENSFRFDS